MFEGDFVRVQQNLDRQDKFEIVFAGRHIVARFYSEQMADALAEFFDGATERGLPIDQNERLIIAKILAMNGASYLISEVLRVGADTKSRELTLLRDNERIWREKY